jgi:3-hydroxyacyl-[acyl-carrier-protein] dehydratase
MRYYLVDRILEAVPGRSLRAVKFLTLGEEYLADHFPGFPVLPGVFMLQALTEAGAWLLRVTDDFAHSVTVLREARNVKYGTFVVPGSRLDLEVELTRRQGDTAVLKGRGSVAGNVTVSAQLTLVSYNLRDRLPSAADRDQRLAQHWRDHYALLRGDLRPASEYAPGPGEPADRASGPTEERVQR